MGNDGLARQIVIYMIVVPTFGVVAVASVFGVGCLGGMAAATVSSPGAPGGGMPTSMSAWLVVFCALILLLCLIWLALWAWYIFILNQVRSAISRRLC